MNFFDVFWHRMLKRPYKLVATQVGSGPTTVVLLHGVAASGNVWTPLIRCLDPTRYRVIVPDLLGFGDSPKPKWPAYSVDDHARAVLAALRKRRLKRASVVIIGHSMGCLVAAHMAVLQPQTARHLILYEPPLLGEIPDFPRYTKRSTRYRTVFEFIASHPQLAHVEARLLWRIARKLWGAHLSEEEWLPFERSLRNTILEQRAYEELRDTILPTDIVYGRLDLIVIRRGIERMFAHNKYVHLHLVTDFHGISARSARYLVSLLTD
jgi:cis-3-alkyl-4-acyloxetan-2-one decarboxylase